MSESPVRKPVYLLDERDLQDNCLWEFCSDEEGVEGQDEATVKPSAERAVLGYSPGSYVIASDLTLADGTRIPGYTYSGRSGDFGCLQPNLLVAGHQINLWLGWRSRAETESAIKNLYKLLEKPAARIFPLFVETRAAVNGSLLRFVVPGFMGTDEKGNLFVRT